MANTNYYNNNNHDNGEQPSLSTIYYFLFSPQVTPLPETAAPQMQSATPAFTNSHQQQYLAFASGSGSSAFDNGVEGGGLSSLEDDDYSTTSSLIDDDIDIPDSDCTLGVWYHSVMITLFVLGVLGNALSVVVMSRRSLRARSFSLSLILLATLNSLALFFEALSSGDTLASRHYGSLEEHIGPIGCKIYRYLPTVITLMDHWVVVFITCERFVAVYFPRSLNVLFSEKNSRIIFSVMFVTVAATQVWRPVLDTQEPAIYENGTNGTLELVSPAVCTAQHLPTYVDIDSFLYQLTLLFFLPALSILVMNSAVIMKIYHDDHTRALRKRLKAQQAYKQNLPFADYRTNQSPTAPAGMRQHRRGVDDPNLARLLTSYTSQKEAASAQEQKIRKATLLLLAITCSFLLYITPHLALLLYVRFHHILRGGFYGYIAFLRVCQVSDFV